MNGAPSFGTENQRVLKASSDHNGVLTLYVIKPLACASVGVSMKAPVCERSNGNAPLNVLGMFRNAVAKGRLVRP